ncbi:MAG: hypothetical protein AB1810_14980 [Pseudomonadota bacterium]
MHHLPHAHTDGLVVHGMHPTSLIEVLSGKQKRNEVEAGLQRG